METIERLLVEHPFFKNLDSRYFKLILGCASNVRFEAGKYIFHEGEEANEFYLVRQGMVALEIPTGDETPIIVQTVAGGDVLGWSWLLPPYYWHFDARAEDLTLAIAFDGKCLRGKCEKNHHLGYELLKRFSHIIASRLDATRLQLLDIYRQA